MNRGDMILDRFPHPSGLRGKKRPALIVKSDDNGEDAQPWRGVYALEFPEEVLFTKQIEIRPEKLDEWRPQEVTSVRRVRNIDE